MILQALNDYYDRKAAEPDSDLAPFGFEWKELPFIIEINGRGELVQVEDTRDGPDKKKTARSFLVPQGVKKTSGVAANLLWDNAEYVLGTVTRKEPEPDRIELEKQLERVSEQHQVFIDKIKALPEPASSDEGVQAAIAFLENFEISSLEKHFLFKEFNNKPNLSFRLQSDPCLVCQRPAVISAVGVGSEELVDPDAPKGICLITGDVTSTERIHTSIKGVWGAQTSGANIVSFNLDASNSFGKKQGFNAPVSKKAVFAYTTALNHLLRKSSPQRMQVGDTSTVFWSAKPTAFETGIVDIFGEPPKDDPDKNTRAVASLYNSINSGLVSSDEGQTRFFVLGLAPNSARIAIRFWEVSNIAEMSVRIRRHFDDLAVVHGDKQLPHLPMFRLLVSTATQGKADNIPPNLAGETMRSILSGQPYPQSLLSSAIRRNRAEQDVPYQRAALIKACINRLTRYKNPEIKEELTVALDESNSNIGYRLGRLFAVLEKVQEEANPGINATIRDRYYGAASSTPVSVFSTLLKLKNHHISKLVNKGRATNLEKLIGQIMDAVTDFPPNLIMRDQGRFAIGYYHQRQAFFKKNPGSDTGESV